MANYRDIYQKKKEHANSEHTPRKEADHQSVHVKRKKDSNRIHTPVDPAELSSADRKRLLEKRISQLEENERHIANIQQEMAHSSREKSRTSYHSQNSGSRRPSDSDTYVISRGSKASISNASMPIPEDEIDTTDYDKYRYMSDVTTKNVRNVRKAGRNYRMSVRSKAEQLLIDRRIRSRGRQRASVIKNTEQMLSGRNTKDYRADDNYKENINRSTQANSRPPRPRDRFFPCKDDRSWSSPSDDEFVEVPEYVDSDTSSVHRAYSLPPPRTRKSMRSDIPSAAQVHERVNSNCSS